MDILDYTGTKFINSPIDLPTIGGNSGEKGKTGVIVQLYIGGKLFEVPVDPKTGLFSWTATEPFPDGDYSVSIRTLDRAGNLSAPTLRTMRIDTTPPNAPELLNLYDDVGGKKGSFDPGQTTDDKRPKLTGIAQEGTLVYLRDADGNTIGSARADEVTGKWVMDPDKDLEEGVNNLVLVAEETFGGVTREGAPSASFKIIIGADSGILPPDTITITQAIDDAGSATGVLSNGALTDDTTPTLNGVVSAGSTVTVYYRLAGSNIWAGSATATVTGENWTWTPGSALPGGTYEFQASIGSTSSALFLLDIAAGADDIQKKTRIESAQDDFGTWQGPLSNGAITDDTTPTLSGRGEANGKVVVRYGQPGQSASTVVVDVDSSGHWTWTPASNLQTGNWGFEVQQQGQSRWSDSFDLSIDSNDRFTPVITHAYDDVGTPQNLVNGDTTNDSTPTLKGTGMPGSVITVEYAPPTGGWIYAGRATVNASGNWEMTSPVLNSSGKYDYRAKANDGNNESAWSPTFGLNFDDLPDGGYEDFSEVLSTGAIQAGYERTFTSGLKLKLVTYAEEVVRGNLATPGFGDPGLWRYSGYRVIDGSNTRFTFPKPTNSFTLDIKVVQHGILTLFGADGRQLGQEILGAGVGNGNKSFTETYRAYGGEKVASFALRSLDGYDDAGFGLVSVEWGSGRYSSFEVEENDNSFLNDSTETATASYIEDDVHSVSHVNDLYTMPVIGNASKTDTLQLTGKDQFLDLTTLSSQIESVEIIDITGSGDNTLKLDLNALLQHGEKDLFIEDGKTQLVVNGNEGDVVQLVDILPEGSDISEWQHHDGTVTVAGVEYNVYSHNDAELLVQQGVKTELV